MVCGGEQPITEVAAAQAAAFPVLFDQRRDAAFLCDGNGRIIAANLEAVKLIGRPREELAGELVLKFIQSRGRQLEWKETQLESLASLPSLRLQTGPDRQRTCQLRYQKLSSELFFLELIPLLPLEGQLSQEIRPRAPDSAGIIVFGLDGHSIFVNRNAASLFGYESAAALIGCPIANFLESAETASLILESVRDRHIWTGHVMARKPDGEMFCTHLTATLFANDSFGPRTIMASFVDMETRYAIEDALLAIEQRYATIVSSMLEGVLLQSAQGEVIEVNESACRILGMSSEHLIGSQAFESSWRFVDENGGELPVSQHPNVVAMAAGKPQVDRVLGISKPDAGITWVRVNSRPLMGPNQSSPLAVLTTFQEVTAEKNAVADLARTREQLAQKSRYLQAIFDVSTVGYAIVDRQRILRFRSPSATRITGYTDADLLGKDFLILGLPQDQERLQKQFREFLSGPETVFQTCEKIRHKDGHFIWLELMVHNLLDDPAIQGLLVAFKDATMRVKQTQEIEESREFFEALVRSIEGIVWEADANTFEFKFVSQNAVRILGYSLVDWIGHEIWEKAIHPDDYAEVIRRCREHISRGENHVLEFRMITKDGKVIWVRDLVSVIKRADEPYLLRGLMIDVSQFKKFEQALRESEQLLAETGRVSQVGGWSYDLLTHELRWTLETRKIHEVNADFVPTWDAALGYFAPEGKSKLQAAICDATHQGLPWDLELPFLLTHDRKRLVRIVGRVVVEMERPVRLFGTYQDISQSRAAELEQAKLYSQLLQAKRLESLGRLAGGISHEFNNILVVILNYVEVLRFKIPEKADYQYLDEIKSAVQRATNLIQRLQAYARKQPGIPLVIQVARTLNEMQPILHSYLGASRQLEISCAADPLCVKMDPVQFDQVLTNLITNARDATANDGVVSIQAVRRETAQTDFGKAGPGPFVHISVSDNGLGIPPDALGHLFEPFYSTKKWTEGAGLGLATVYGIVTQAGGSVDVESQQGKGSTFHIYLPACSAEQESSLSYEELLLSQSN